MKPHEEELLATRSDHHLPVAAALVKRDFMAAWPNQLWVPDITYLWTWEGWLYLAAVMDVHDREIVGWALRERLTKDLVVDACNRQRRHSSLNQRSPMEYYREAAQASSRVHFFGARPVPLDGTMGQASSYLETRS